MDGQRPHEILRRSRIWTNITITLVCIHFVLRIQNRCEFKRKTKCIWNDLYHLVAGAFWFVRLTPRSTFVDVGFQGWQMHSEWQTNKILQGKQIERMSISLECMNEMLCVIDKRRTTAIYSSFFFSKAKSERCWGGANASIQMPIKLCMSQKLSHESSYHLWAIGTFAALEVQHCSEHPTCRYNLSIIYEKFNELNDISVGNSHIY